MFYFLRHFFWSSNSSPSITPGTTTTRRSGGPPPPFKSAMDNHDLRSSIPPPSTHRPNKLHRRLSSSPDSTSKSPRFGRRLLKRNSPNIQHQRQGMDTKQLGIPPALTISNLPADKELLQRWAAGNSSTGKSIRHIVALLYPFCHRLGRIRLEHPCSHSVRYPLVEHPGGSSDLIVLSQSGHSHSDVLLIYSQLTFTASFYTPLTRSGVRYFFFLSVFLPP
jgi:hypothetical protein